MAESTRTQYMSNITEHPSVFDLQLNTCPDGNGLATANITSRDILQLTCSTPYIHIGSEELCGKFKYNAIVL